MIDVFPFAGCKVAVFGLGRSGIATALALQKSGAQVLAWDDAANARAFAENKGVILSDLYACEWGSITSLIVSPGVPINFPEVHPVVAKARAANTEIIGDIELLIRTQSWCNFIGITGTNGKSTTTALLGHVMQTSGRDAEIGGNLGIPVLTLQPLGAEGVYVIEMSSFQLELTPSAIFDVAVLLNISADHLARHGGMEGYIAAKRAIFQRQTKPRAAIIGTDDEICRNIYDQLRRADEQLVIPVSGYQQTRGGVYAIDGFLFDDTEDAETPICNLRQNPTLLGSHNGQNAAAAYAASKVAGVSPNAIMACLLSYPGLVHRQEAVDIVGGVAYVNDSKATNGEAAARAIKCFDNVYWILGGKPKDDGLKPCMPFLKHVRHAYLIGEAALAFSQVLDGKVPFTLSENLENAISAAHARALSEGYGQPVVVLSPACASFDQFSNFENRGDAFKELVNALPGKHVDPFEEPGVFPGTSNFEQTSRTGL